MSEEILNIKEACEFLGVKPRTMYALLKQSRVPAIKIGGQWRFSKEMLLKMFHEQASQSHPVEDKNEKKNES